MVTLSMFVYDSYRKSVLSYVNNLFNIIFERKVDKSFEKSLMNGQMIKFYLTFLPENSNKLFKLE